MLKQHAERTPPYRGPRQALGGLIVVALLVLCASVAFSPGDAEESAVQASTGPMPIMLATHTVPADDTPGLSPADTLEQWAGRFSSCL